MNTVNFKNQSITFFTEVNNNFSRFVSGEETYIVVGETWEGNLFRVAVALNWEDARHILCSARNDEMPKMGWQQSHFAIYKIVEGEVYRTYRYSPARRATPDEETEIIRLWVGGYPRTSRQKEMQ